MSVPLPDPQSASARITIGDASAGGAWYTTKRVPLRSVQLSSSAIPRDDKRAEAVATLIALQDQQLEEWDGTTGFTFALPNTAFADATAPITPLSALMRSPVENELSHLVRDETGTQRKLTPEMLRALKRDGRFSFPSAAFPPLEHVWQLPSWLQRGSVRIREDFLAWIGWALDQVLVQCRRRIGVRQSGKGKKAKGWIGWMSKLHLNMWKGMKSLGKGTIAFINVIVGLPAYRPRRDQYEFSDRFIEEERDFLVQNAEDDLDMRLYSNENAWDEMKYIRSSTAHPGQDFGRMTDAEMRQEELEDYSNIFRPNDPETDERTEEEQQDGPERMEKRVQDHYIKRGRERLLRSTEEMYRLTRISPQLPALAKNELEAKFIRDDIMGLVREAVKEREEAVTRSVREEAPLRSLGKLWLEQEVQRRMQTLCPELGGDALERVLSGDGEGQELRYVSSAIRSEFEDQVVEALEARGPQFEQEARLERLRLRFRRERWPIIEKEMLRERVPATEMCHQRIKYRVSRWVVEGEHGPKLEVYHETKTTSTFVGWRLVGQVRNAWTNMLNGLFKITVGNLWAGPLGVQALFRGRKFATGAPVLTFGRRIEREERGHTLRTRLKAIWADVQKKRREFEAADDTGFVSKGAVRWLHYIRNYLFRGVVATILCAVFQPLLTALNIAITSILLVTAPIWAVLLEALGFLCQVLLYDYYAWNLNGVKGVRSYEESPFGERYAVSHSGGFTFFPLLQIGWQVLVSGVGQTVLSVLCATILYPLLALGGAVFAGVGAAFRTCADTVFRGLLGQFGRWPATDTWLAQRVAGPGISSTYYYRLNQEVLSQCIRARLEKFEMEIVAEKLFSVIREPEEAFGLYCTDTTRHIIDHEFAESDVISRMMSASSVGKRLSSCGNAIRKRLVKTLGRREKNFDALLRMPVDADRIRPAADPAVAVAENVDGVRNFYETRLEPLGAEYSLDLWKDAAVPVGDMTGLTRHLLRSIFCKEFLVELIVSDRDLIIPVTFDGVLDRDNFQMGPSEKFPWATDNGDEIL